MEEQEQTQEQENNLTIQQKFEQTLQEDNFKSLKWKKIPELGLVLYNSDKQAFLNKFYVKPDATTLEIDKVMDTYNEEVARRLQEGADQETIKQQSFVYKEQLSEAKKIVEHYSKISEWKKNMSFTLDSFHPNLCNSSSANELLKNNLVKLKKGEGKLMKFLKPRSSRKNDYLVFEEDDKGHFRKGKHYILRHDSNDTTTDFFPSELTLSRNEVSYLFAKNLLKHSFTFEAKVVNEKSVKVMHFEVDLEMNFRQIFEVVRRVLATKIAFVGLEFFTSKGSRIELVEKGWLVSNKNLHNDDYNEFATKFEASQALLKHQVKTEKIDINPAEENTDTTREIKWLQNSLQKKLYLDANFSLHDSSNLDTNFFESFINSPIYVVPLASKDLRLAQTFEKLSHKKEDRSIRYDIFSLKKDVKLHGIAIFSGKFVLVHDDAFKIKVTFKNLSTGICSWDTIEFKENSEAGIRKVFGNQLLEVKEGQFVKVEIEPENVADEKIKTRMLGFIRDVEDGTLNQPQATNDSDVIFTRKNPRFICGVYFSCSSL